MNRKQALNKACFLLRNQAKEESLAKFLLQYLLEENSSDFLLNITKPLDLEISKKYFMLISKHIETNMPLSHLVGFDYFYDRKFYVTKDVLSPRMETEELVYKVINYVKKRNKNLKILDLCTGSGIIGITLKKELSNIDITCSDISTKALNIAKENSVNLDAEVKFIKSDLFDNITEKYDIIVSNPPYIPFSEKNFLEENVLSYDPHLALFAEENGLYFYRKIIENANEYLTEEGVIFFEIGHNQKEDLINLATKNNFNIEVFKDINNKDRIVVLKKHYK